MDHTSITTFGRSLLDIYEDIIKVFCVGHGIADRWGSGLMLNPFEPGFDLHWCSSLPNRAQADKPAAVDDQ